MKLVFTPDWFLGKDVLIDSFSFIVLVIFFLLCVRNYKLNKKKNLLYLGIGFLLIAVAQLSTVFTKLVLYYDTSFIQQIGQLVITYNIVKSVDIFYQLGFLLHKLLTLLGFYVMYKLPLKKSSSSDNLLMLYFIFISVVFSTSAYYIFHITASLLLLFIINNYYHVYKKNKSINTKILASAFCILFLSQFIFILSKLQTFYVLANIVELASYLTLLFLIARIEYGHSKK